MESSALKEPIEMQYLELEQWIEAGTPADADFHRAGFDYPGGRDG